MTVCWRGRGRARQTAHEIWPSGSPASGQELPTPAHFEQAVQLVTAEKVAETSSRPGPQKHLERIDEYAQAGFDHVYVHQIGPDQEGFIRFAEREILPHYAGTRAPRPALTRVSGVGCLG